VIVDAKSLQDLVAHLPAQLVLCQCTVCPQGTDEADLIILYSGCKQLVDHEWAQLIDPRGPRHIVEDDHGLLLAARKVAETGLIDGMIDGIGTRAARAG
jgi:hypothetical protein